MVFLSAFEDFVTRSVPGVPTLLGRLEYVAGLRRGNRYSHWGLAKVHGEQAASDAISRAHSDIWLAILRTPLPELFAQMQNGGSAEGEELLRVLSEHLEDAIPADRNGGVPAHLSSILEALAALSTAAKAPSRRAA
jgi:hypothetical protein